MPSSDEEKELKEKIAELAAYSRNLRQKRKREGRTSPLDDPQTFVDALNRATKKSPDDEKKRE